jgi:excisionase family DNA binding protein
MRSQTNRNNARNGKLLRLAEAAERIGIQYRDFWVLARYQAIPAVRVGSQYLITEVDLNAWTRDNASLLDQIRVESSKRAERMYPSRRSSPQATDNQPQPKTR